MFESSILEKIRTSGQAYKFSSPCCELEPPEFLYMGNLYEAVSTVVPKDMQIIDLGCYMAAQAFLFDGFRGYTGVDEYDVPDAVRDYTPPERFVTPNVEHVSDRILNYISGIRADGRDTGNMYAIMSAVPEAGQPLKEAVLANFKNVAVWYPGEEPVIRGCRAEEIKRILDVINGVDCPYSLAYLKEHADVAEEYRKKREAAEKLVTSSRRR
ncbi:MAG: hypothetical protein J5966_02270 [Lachnospiraceae bacterium]|nr:hypothetical protein [Lachnospiraceae bacterium]